MKFQLILIIATALLQSSIAFKPADLSTVNAAFKACCAKLGVPTITFEEAETKQDEFREEHSCLPHCVATKLSLHDKAGPNEDNIVAQYTQYNPQKTKDECRKIVTDCLATSKVLESNPCTRAIITWECVENNGLVLVTK